MDFNFFEPYKKVPIKTNKFNLFVICVLSLGLGGMGILTLSNFISINSSKNEIKAIKSQSENPELTAKLATYDWKIQNVKALELEINNLENIIRFTNNKHTGSEKIISYVSNQLTSNMFLTELKITNRELRATGIAANLDVIADFETNIRKTGYFNDIFVEGLDKNQVNFTMDDTVAVEKKDLPYNFTLTAIINDKALADNYKLATEISTDTNTEITDSSDATQTVVDEGNPQTVVDEGNPQTIVDETNPEKVIDEGAPKTRLKKTTGE